MKNVFTLFVLLMFVMSFGSALAGPGFGNRNGMHGDYEQRAEHMRIVLDLDDAQYEQIKAILKKNHEKWFAEMEKRRTEMEKYRDIEDSEIKAVLNREQSDKFQKLENQRYRKWDKR